MTYECIYKVSAVIPSYNSERYIRETIYSLINQTQPLSEIIVVDDCSNDNTCSIVKMISEESEIPVKLFNNTCNQGAAIARNKGISAALGDWILLMDSDDVAEPKLVELECKKLNYLKQDYGSNWVIAYPAYRQIDENGNLISLVTRGKQVEIDETFGYEIVRNLITTSGVLLDKAITMKNEGFAVGMRYHEDWELWLRLAEVGGFAYVDEPLVRVRRHSANTTKSMDKVISTENEVLGNYSIDVIKKGIYKRKLSDNENLSDYVSILYKMGFWELGFKELDSVKAGYIDDSIMFLRGLYYTKIGLYDSAQECFKRAVRLNYRNGAAINNLAIQDALSGNIEEARLGFERALELYPGYIDAQSNIRLLESKEGLNQSNCRYTWRELRPVLLHYSE